MLKELDTLREVGAQKIHEDTHIALNYVQSIIHESFEDLTKIQLLGFISILEREYNQELPDLRAKGIEYFKAEFAEDSTNKGVFVVPKTNRKKTGLYIFITLSIFIVAIYFSFDFNAQKKSVAVVDNSAIENAQKNMKPIEPKKIIIDENLSDAKISTQTIEKAQEKVQKTEKVEKIEKAQKIETVKKTVKVVKKQKLSKPTVMKKLSPLLILPRSKVWIGYINKTDGIKKQTVIKHRLALNPNKEWLISLGHGYISMEVNGKKKRYSSAQNIRFRYIDGKLKELSVNEFKKLNKGRLW